MGTQRVLRGVLTGVLTGVLGGVLTGYSLQVAANMRYPYDADGAGITAACCASGTVVSHSQAEAVRPLRVPLPSEPPPAKAEPPPTQAEPPPASAEPLLSRPA
jgi:hypothetical protein